MLYIIEFTEFMEYLEKKKLKWEQSTINESLQTLLTTLELCFPPLKCSCIIKCLGKIHKRLHLLH